MENMLVNKGFYGGFAVLHPPHYQWCALPLSYRSILRNFLTFSIDGLQAIKSYSATIGCYRNDSAGAGGDFTGITFACCSTPPALCEMGV